MTSRNIIEIKPLIDQYFWGSVNLIRAVLPSMRARKSGRIMNISAIAGFSNEVGFSIYGGAKFALEGLSESLSSDLRHLGIKVIIVEPGPFRTDFISRSMERSTNVMDDYRQSTGKFAAYLEKFAGSQPGDPALAADAMLDTCLNERPPQRLVLGKFAHKKVRDKLKRVEDELNQWQAVSEPTDFV